MKLLVITGSRADYGLLEWPLKLLNADPYFDVDLFSIWNTTVPYAYNGVDSRIHAARNAGKPHDMALMLGDRFEIMAAALACHLERLPIAHIGGGDVTEGSYDDAMRDCITRMASIHFATSNNAKMRLELQLPLWREHNNALHIHMVGSPGVDYIMHADWKRERPCDEHYAVVSYQAETIDDDGENISECFESLDDLPPETRVFYIVPNMDAGSDKIRSLIEGYCAPRDKVLTDLSHAEFLNLINHCDELIGNSSAILYEAPFMGVKTRMIGKRQRGRVQPEGDGKASERIVKVLKEWRK